MGIAKQIRCHGCGVEFSTEDASMCGGCNPNYEAVDPWGFKYEATFPTYDRTLRCPHCGACACSKIKEWEKAGKLVYTPESSRFEWVHSDLVS